MTSIEEMADAYVTATETRQRMVWHFNDRFFDAEGACRACAHGGEPDLNHARACPDCVCVAGQKLRAEIEASPSLLSSPLR